MQTTHGHLTYCTNIHPGATWTDHFTQLREHIPAIKAQVSPHQPFGIGLRLSNTASLELAKETELHAFQEWLQQENCYVFTMNGFPYGSFHHTTVKDQVHTPDWTTQERVAYTIRLFRMLAALLPDGMEGGISTSPLSYKHWHVSCPTDKTAAIENATLHILLVVEQLARIRAAGGPLLHLDIEPEPDGMLENTGEYIDWYFQYLLPAGIPFMMDKCRVDEATAVEMIKSHVQLCYDVCHFALVYETPQQVLQRLAQHQLKVGKVQISAALRALMPEDTTARNAVVNAFRAFDEPVYLHQVIARTADGTLLHYPDLPQALEDAANPAVTEWRSHFHVPVFVEQYDLLQSTQADIRTLLAIQRQQPFTAHLEVETYTWDVLPPALKVPAGLSVARELQWVLTQLA